ncbi:ribonuclease [Lachnospiraceae bacterium]|nr:ribonuclease [Lachnospiraceae bacterium]
MKLIFVGAAHEVTGSCHYLNACGKHILVDYGMEQGVNVFENCELPVQEAMIDYVLLTHAHVDHSGMIPLLSARGFRGQILTTRATADLCSIMLRDCAHIQMQEAEWKNRKAKRSAGIDPHQPVYTMEDADAAIKRIVPCDYGQEIELCEGIKIRFTDVGHLLGSASIEVWATEEGSTRKIVFSGDIGNKNQPLIKDPARTKDADILFLIITNNYSFHGCFCCWIILWCGKSAGSFFIPADHRIFVGQYADRIPDGRKYSAWPDPSRTYERNFLYRAFPAFPLQIL